MTIAARMAAIAQAEAAATRTTLERIPADRYTWKPDPKSSPAGQLAMHVAQLPGFAAAILAAPVLDMAVYDRPPYRTAESPAQLTTRFDAEEAEFEARLATMTDEAMAEQWTMVAGPHVICAMPRWNAMQAMFFGHLAHHRAQLGVYLRLLGVPVPGCYGPTADER